VKAVLLYASESRTVTVVKQVASQQMPVKDHKYTLARHNMQQKNYGRNWRADSASAAKKKKVEDGVGLVTH